MLLHQGSTNLPLSLLIVLVLPLMLLVFIPDVGYAASLSADATEKVACDSQDNLQCANNGKCTVLVRQSQANKNNNKRPDRVEPAKCECADGFSGDKCEEKSKDQQPDAKEAKSGGKFGDWATAAATVGAAVVGLMIIVFIGSVLYIGYVNKRTSSAINKRGPSSVGSVRSSTGTASQKMSQMSQQKTSQADP
ncbi:hypothetical protein BOX15_Mlig028837g1 [Macrostomum lignano]|uniref:EGF-like domain-containing protein n=1 Tax=Macrostomum lignano TaxID=282301 RepID=A0A267FXN6_9PLAT|nr:hypothetical protein BOX15_Mlig028837g1 [Macrostomum lignano]